MGSLDRINNRWGNIDKTLNDFTSKYPNERIIYRSSGALFKRKGDTRFSYWTSPINYRGNLIVSQDRCYFSNPLISGRSIYFTMIPAYLVMVITMALISTAFIFGLTENILLSGTCLLVFMPIIVLMLLSICLNVYQRIPRLIELPYSIMKKRYLGTYKSISMPCPMFSCYDGKDTYHFIGYNKLNEYEERNLNHIFFSVKDKKIHGE